MPVIMFLIDNSASMNQRTFYGTTLLDVARGAVDQFTKMRERDIHSRWDRRMLLTLEEPPHHIKAGWKESVSVFNSELRNMKANGMTAIGAALGRAFDLLNLNRAQTGLDCFGQGRYPTSNESAIIICITDGQKLTSEDGSANEIVIPGPQVPLSDLYLEPFRWDQRLYSLVLRMAGTDDRSRELTNGNQFVEKASDSPINAMCEVTGGRSYKIENLRQLNQCLESICQKCQSGAVLNFQMQPDQKLDAVLQNSLKMVYLKQNQRGFNNEHWPLPEPYWPTADTYSLPPRQAHPIVRFSILKTDVQIPDRFPFDKFELEASPLTQYILEMRDSNCVWECSVPGSGYRGSQNEHAPPFGFLKASSNFQTVNLFVLPFNYPVLFRLIDEFHRTRHHLTEDFHDRFKTYMERVPAYYYHRLSYVLEQQGMPRQFLNNYREVGNNSGLLSLHVKTVLSRSKANAKAEFDKMVRDIANKGVNDEKIQIKLQHSNRIVGCDQPNESLDIRTFVCDGFQRRGDVSRVVKVHRPYENPYDIKRCDLRSFLPKMRHNLEKLIMNECRPMDSEGLHEQPMMQMGNFHEYLQKNQALRPIEEGPQRQHSFGNPFKVRNAIVIDEADSDFPNNGNPMPGSRRSRTPSVCSETSSIASNSSRITLPLSPDFSYKAWRTSSRPSSPASHRLGAFDDEQRNGVDALTISGASNGIDANSPGSPSECISSPELKKAIVNSSTTFVVTALLKRIHSLVKMIRAPKIDGKRVHRKLSELDCEPKLQKDILNYLIAEAHRFQRQTLANLFTKRMSHIRCGSEDESPSPISEETEPVLSVNSKQQTPTQENLVSGLGTDFLSYLPQSHGVFEGQRHKLKTRTNGASETPNGIYHPPLKMMRLDMAPAGIIR